MSALLHAYVEHHTPAWARAAGPEGTRRAHLVLWFGLLMESQALVFGILYLILGLPGPALTLVVPGLLLLPLPRLLARDAGLAAHWLFLLVVCALDGLAWWTGGLRAPGLWWTAILPALATLAAGRSSGVVWVGVCALNVLGIAVLDTFGFDGDNVLPEWTVAPVIAMGITMLGFAVWALARLHETTRIAMVEAVAATNAGLRRVLDNVEQGFLVADTRGVVAESRSGVLARWFEEPRPGEPLWAWIGRHDAAFAGWLELGWEAVFEGFLPVELAVDQLPRRLVRDGRVYSLAWRPVGTPPSEIVVIVTDRTEEEEARRSEQLLRERTGLLERLRRDPVGLLQFHDEGERLLGTLEDRALDTRLALHTLKGNCAVFGLQSVADMCHRVEASAAERGGRPDPGELDAVRRAWVEIMAPTQDLLREERARVTVPRADLFLLERAIAHQAPHDELAAILVSWRYERTADALQRLADRAESLARRLGKPLPRVVVADHGLRVDPGRWAAVWQAMIHAVRNAVDHGIEPAADRVAAGKSPMATLRFTTSLQAGAVVLSLEDDGRGVDWARVAELAQARGLPHASFEDLQEVLFASGVSTRGEATDVSGRGVGLGALRQAAAALGGELSVVSNAGCGTIVRVIVPEAGARLLAA